MIILSLGLLVLNPRLYFLCCRKFPLLKEHYVINTAKGKTSFKSFDSGPNGGSVVGKTAVNVGSWSLSPTVYTQSYVATRYMFG